MDFLLLLLFAAFSEGMVDDGGYTDVVNIDISSVVIEAMQNKYRDRPQLKCILNYDELMSYRYHDFHIWLRLVATFVLIRSSMLWFPIFHVIEPWNVLNN